MQGQLKKENSSGIVRLQGDQVLWEYDNKTILQIDVNNVAIIGEYTNADGPYFDDLFLTFVMKDGQWQSIPWYADNIDGLTQYLSNKFHEDLDLTFLANSTEWKSIVRYPTHLKEKPLFILTPSANYKEPKTLLQKILSSISVGNYDTTQNIGLTEEVKYELTNVRL